MCTLGPLGPISMTSATRKTKKLVEMGLLERVKSGRKFIYKTPDHLRRGVYRNPDGIASLDAAVDEVIAFVDTLVRL